MMTEIKPTTRVRDLPAGPCALYDGAIVLEVCAGGVLSIEGERGGALVEPGADERVADVVNNVRAWAP